MLICAIVQDDCLAQVMSHDFTKRNIGIKGEITNGRILFELSLLSAFQISYTDNGDVNLRLTQRQCDRFQGMHSG